MYAIRSYYGHARVVEREGDVVVTRQRAQDVLQLARGHGDAGVFSARGDFRRGPDLDLV